MDSQPQISRETNTIVCWALESDNVFTSVCQIGFVRDRKKVAAPTIMNAHHHRNNNNNNRNHYSLDMISKLS